MTDRSRILGDSGPNRRHPARLEPGRRRRPAGRPTVEALEGRALLSTAGGPDSTYAGFVEFQPPSGTQTSIVTGEARQSDGKVVVVGYDQSIPAQFGPPGGSTIDLARLNVDGSVDTTFGTKGVIVLPALAGGEDTGEAVLVQPDGKIVVVANVTPLPLGPPADIAAYRLNADGSFDTTFGTGGVVNFGFVQNNIAISSSATALAIQADGKIVIGADARSGVGIARLNADGSPDATFGTAGQVLVPITAGTLTLADSQGVAGLAIQPDGSIDYDTTVVPGTGAGEQIAVGRLTATGSPDATFGAGGQVILAGSSADTAGALAIQPDGKLVVAGAYFSIDAAVTTSTTHFDVYRLNGDGTLDKTFGATGEATPVEATAQLFTIAGNATQAVVHSVLIQPDGKIVVGGTLKRAPLGQGSPTLARLNSDGSPDNNFGTGGQEVLPAGGFNPYLTVLNSVNGLTIQPDGRLLATTVGGVTRLLVSGASNDFNNDGKSDLAVLLTNFNYPIFAYHPSGGGPDVLEAFGIPGAGQTLPAPGAYDGNGVDELGVYLPSIGAFAYRSHYGNSTYFNDQVIPIGLAGAGRSIPAPADYTGSGHTEIGVYEPSTGAFVYSPANSPDPKSDVTVPFGIPGAGNTIPTPADYYGTGRDDIAVYLPQYAAFAIQDPTGKTTGQVIPFGQTGAGNSIPVPGDYDGSGHVEAAVYLPSLGAFAYRPYGTSGSADKVIGFGMPGQGNSIPMPGDYDGSGHTELAVYLPTLHAFAYRPYGGGADVIEGFGSPGVGNTIPFDAAGAAAFAGGGGGSPGAIRPPASPGWVDFVPDLAGPAKKAEGGSSSTRS